MSTFGVISILVFLLLMGGLVTLESAGNSDLPMAKILMFLLRLLVVAELLLAIYEFPAYLADGIFFACMGVKWLAEVMFAIVACIVLFVLVMILCRVKWDKHLTATPMKLILLGIIMVGLFTYTELFNGFYSFDSVDQFREVKSRYEEYDNHFFPTKFIYHYDKDDELEKVALYPFDITTDEGAKLPMLYKGETYMVKYEDGTTELFFYPFTLKLYEGTEPVSFRNAAYSVQPEKAAAVSGSDASASDTSASAE